MLIIWGTRVTKKRLGYVADYCVRCRDAQRFRVFEHRSHRHIYLIPVTRPRRVTCSIRCERCKSEAFTDSTDAYRDLVRDRKASLEELCDRTNPNLPQAIAARLDARDRIAAGTASAEDRMSLILESIGWAIAPVEMRAAQTHIDRWIVLTFLGVFLGPALVLPLAAIAGDVVFGIVAVGALVLFIGLFIWTLLTEVRRYYRRRVEPVLLDLLGPIQPTVEELEITRAWLQGRDCQLQRYLDPARLVERLRTWPQATPPTV